PPSVFRSEYLCSFEDSSDALFLPAVLRRAQVVDDTATDDEVFSFAEFMRSEKGGAASARRPSSGSTSRAVRTTPPPCIWSTAAGGGALPAPSRSRTPPS